MAGAIRQQLSLLLSAYGYNLYDDKNRMRADDVLVRGQAAGALGEAAGRLATLRTEYRRRFIPASTREQPYPPADRLARLGEMARLQERVADLETRIRAMPAPTSDRVWERLRHEETTLAELLAHDYGLIQPCYELRDMAQALTVETWTGEADARLDGIMGRIEEAIRARSTFLRV